VFYIWNGLRTADYYNKKNDLCGKIPSEQNFVNSVLKYGIFFTTQNGIDKNNIFKSGIKVGYNSNTNQRYLQELMNSHGVEWQLVRYENSKGVRLGVVNNEVDFGMINSAASYWKKTKKLKLKALFTLNSNGENDITALADVSDFKGAGNGIADMFLLEGGDNIKLRKIVSKILNDPDSKISLWYSTAKGYTQTVDMDLNEAIEVTENAIENWVKR
jgi:tripartite-type tricarboxylate transporter receptor subunit TctC